MKQITLILVMMLLGACATQNSSQAPRAEQTDNQAVIDFIAVRQLEEMDKIRSNERDGWDILTTTYIIYKSRRDRYLFEFARPCYELRDNTEVTADVRANARIIHAKFDTLRGCRIARIFVINMDEAEELKNIGEAPGNRN